MAPSQEAVTAVEDNTSEIAPQDDELEHFTFNALAQPTLSDPAFKRIAMSRILTHGGRGHTLTGRTWNTPDTIAHLISYYRYPPKAALLSPIDTNPATRAEVRRFYAFGSGLNAHPDLLHGGVISVILDSSLGGAVSMAMRESVDRANYFTVQLNVKYEKPVRTPATIMVRAWVVKVEDDGRKVWAEGLVESGEKGEIRHAKAEGLWVRAKGKEKL
jgi:acyl-coenzyme A thioesterase PaaI-like protein